MNKNLNVFGDNVKIKILAMFFLFLSIPFVDLFIFDFIGSSVFKIFYPTAITNQIFALLFLCYIMIIKCITLFSFMKAYKGQRVFLMTLIVLVILFFIIDIFIVNWIYTFPSE